MDILVKSWVNICIVKDDKILLLDRQYDNFKGWIYPGGKVEFPESFVEAAMREVKEETGLTVLNLKLKGISGFTNEKKKERYVYYDFLCNEFEGTLIKTSREGNPKWWLLDQLDSLVMQKDVKERIPLFLREGTHEKTHYWDEDKKCIGYTKTLLFD